MNVGCLAGMVAMGERRRVKKNMSPEK